MGEGNVVETGPFDNCGKIAYPFWFSFDPQHPHILYLSQTLTDNEKNRPLRVLDLEKKMIIYGSNFGTDRSIISVKIGGKEAIVVSAKGTSIYCSTPESCYEGTIEIKVGEQTVVASEKYQYEPQMVVTDLCGDVDELGEGNVEEDRKSVV